MGYIVLSKKQVEGSLNVKLCKDKASADSYRKQLIKQYYDVVILSKGDHKLVTNKLFKDWVNEKDNDGGDDINSDKHNGYGGDEEAHKAWDKEGEGKVIEETFINAFGTVPKMFRENEFITKAHGRYNTIKEFYNKGLISKFDRVHLLGCNIPQEFSWYKDMPFIESVDTSNPVIHGLAGVKYKDYGLDEKLPHKVDKFEGDSENWETALYNVEKFREFIPKK